MPTIKMPSPKKRPTSEFYWIRKKVPVGLRALVGKTEVWASLKTKDERKALIKIGAVNAAIEAEWARLRPTGRQPGSPTGPREPAPFQAHPPGPASLRGRPRTSIASQSAWTAKEPPTGFRNLRLSSREEQSLRQEDAEGWLKAARDGGLDGEHRASQAFTSGSEPGTRPPRTSSRTASPLRALHRDRPSGRQRRAGSAPTPTGSSGDRESRYAGGPCCRIVQPCPNAPDGCQGFCKGLRAHDQFVVGIDEREPA